MAHEQDEWREQKLTPTEIYYLGLSEVYLAELDDHVDNWMKIMIAKGVVAEMESDLLIHLEKNPPTERSTQQHERLKVLNSSFDYFSRIASNNNQMKLLLRKSARENLVLKKEIEELKNEKILLNKIIDSK